MELKPIEQKLGAAWKELYTDSTYVRSIRDKYFGGSNTEMGQALGYNVTSVSNWCQTEGQVPPHFNRAAELYTLVQSHKGNKDLQVYIVLVEKTTCDKLEFAVNMLNGTFQKMKEI